MRNVNALITRLGAISLAASMLFSVSFAAAPRQAGKAQAAILQALVHHAAAEATESKAVDATTRTNTITDNTVIGSNATNKNLTVYGTGRFGNDVTVGSISDSSSTPGTKYVIGAQALDPKTQQLELSFKNKTKSGGGAWVTFDFVTTATRKGLTDNGVVSVGLRNAIYCHPQMTAPNIMRSAAGGAGTGQHMRYTTTCVVANAPALTPSVDFRLTPTIRVEAITDDVAIGIVPTGVTTTNGTSGYYDSGYVSNNASSYYTFNPGVIYYQVRSDNLGSVGVVSTVTDDLEPLDVFTLFTDSELETLLEALNEYFGNDATKIREYLQKHGKSLGRAVKALRS